MKYPYKLFFTIVFIFLNFLSSCELYNPAEPIPAYIHLDKFILTKNSDGFPNSKTGDEGSLSHKITDAWVYVDEILIGCFELPVTFPMLSEGSHTLKIRAGIKVNGIAASRAPYPFFDEYVKTIDLQKGTTINVTPDVKYLPGTHFVLMEDFETGGMGFVRTRNSDTTLQKISNPNAEVFEGANSGIAYLDPNATFFEYQTADSFLLPKNSAPIFLEFNYKSNYRFVVSIIAYGSSYNSQFQALTFNPTENWNKTYLYLTPTVSGAYNAANYRVVIGMQNNTGADDISLLLDNIKLVY